MDIFKLVGSVFVDTEEANKSLSKTDEKAEGLGNKLASGVKTAGKWALGITAAAGAVGTAMIASAKDTSANMDVIDKASQRMGIGAESYQELAYAAGLCGVEMSTMEKAAKKLEGTDMNFDEAMQSIYELGTAEERSAKAAELFGEAVAYQMSPMLNASAEDMAAMRQEANDLGLVMSEDTVKAGAEMNDAFSKIDGAVDSVKNQIGSSFMPVLLDLLNWILDHMPEIQEFVGNVITFIQGAIKNLIPIIKSLMPVVKGIFEAVKPLWENILKPVLTGIISFLSGVFTGDWTKIWEGLSDIVSGLFNGLIEIVKFPINAIITLLNSAIDGINKIQIPDWVPLVGGKGLDIPHIPMLAKGGKVEKEGTVIVGEAGPEFLTLPKGAQVTPLNKVGDSEKVLNKMDSMISEMKNMIKTMNAVARRPIALNGKVVSHELAEDMDQELGILAIKNMRGLNA